MSESSQRGKLFELKVAKVLRSKLGAKVSRDRRSGAGINKSDISDYYQEIPLHLELKDQETIKVKEWFRQAEQSASFTQAPTVVFAMDEEVLAVLRFSDLVNFVREIADLRAEVDDLRLPIESDEPATHFVEVDDITKPNSKVIRTGKIPVDKRFKTVVNEKIQRGAKTCRAGHLADQHGYCMQLSCKFSRGYKPPKAKRK